MRFPFPAWPGTVLIPVCLLWATPGLALAHIDVMNGAKQKSYRLELVHGGVNQAEVEITLAGARVDHLPLDPGGEPHPGAVLPPQGVCRIAVQPQAGRILQATLRLIETKFSRVKAEVVAEHVVDHLLLTCDCTGKGPMTTLRRRSSKGGRHSHFHYYTVFETLVFQPPPEHEVPHARPKQLRKLESSGIQCVIL